MNRLTPDAMESACRQFLLQLSVVTIINEHQMTQWRYNHWDELEDAFINSGEPEEFKVVWLREVFAASRLLKSRPVAEPNPFQGASNCVHQRPAGIFAKLFRRGVA